MILRIGKTLALIVSLGTLSLLLCHAAAGPFAATYGPASALRAERHCAVIRMSIAQAARTPANHRACVTPALKDGVSFHGACAVVSPFPMSAPNAGPPASIFPLRC